jgi:hypothetical protein
MARYAEERYNFAPRSNSGQLIDLIREQGAVKRGILQQVSEEQSRAAREQNAMVERLGNTALGEYHKGKEEARADEDQGFKRASEERSQQLFAPQLKGYELQNEGAVTTNMAAKNQLDQTQKHQAFLDAPGADGKPLQETMWTEEGRAPGLQNKQTESSIRSNDAATRNAGGAGALNAKQIQLIDRQIAAEDAGKARTTIVNQLATAKATGDMASYQGILARLAATTPPEQVHVLEQEAATKVRQDRTSTNLTDTADVAKGGQINSALDAQKKVLAVKKLVNAYASYKGTTPTSTDEGVQLDAFRQALDEGKIPGAENLDSGWNRVGFDGIGNTGKMEKIIKTQLADLKGELEAAKLTPPDQRSPQAVESMQQVEMAIQAIEQQLGMRGTSGTKKTRGVENKSWKEGGGAMPPPVQPGQRTMRGSPQGNGAPAPMAPQQQQQPQGGGQRLPPQAQPPGTAPRPNYLRTNQG